MTCPDCERPMATDANLRSDATPRPEDDLRCWRAFHGDQCQRPIDWRARCKAAEGMAEHREDEKADLEEQLCRNEIRGAAERRRLREERDRLDAENTALVEQLFTQATGRDIDADFAASAQAGAEWQARRAEAAERQIGTLRTRIADLQRHYDEARENAPRALTDALSDIARIAGERDQARQQVATLQATVLGLLAVRTLTPGHVEVLRELRREAAVQQARVGADEYAPAWAVEESRVRVEALGAVLGEEPSDA